jgi:ribose transport system permease protein
MTFVLSAGEIDLSIEATARLASVVTAMAMPAHGVTAGILAGIGSGLCVGLLNGVLTVRVGIPSFLTTLAVMVSQRGAPCG